MLWNLVIKHLTLDPYCFASLRLFTVGLLPGVSPGLWPFTMAVARGGSAVLGGEDRDSRTAVTQKCYFMTDSVSWWVVFGHRMVSACFTFGILLDSIIVAQLVPLVRSLFMFLNILVIKASIIMIIVIIVSINLCAVLTLLWLPLRISWYFPACSYSGAMCFTSLVPGPIADMAAQCFLQQRKTLSRTVIYIYFTSTCVTSFSSGLPF